MNKDRRKQIADIISQFRDIPDLAEIASLVRELADAEQEAFENMPGGLQASERGQASEAAAAALSEAADALEGIDISEIESLLEQAAEA